MNPQHRPKNLLIALLCLMTLDLSTSCQNIAQKTDNNQAPWPSDSSAITRIPIQTPVGEFKVWTQRFGQNDKIKILLLHGGPAMTHEYMQCFEPFFIKEQFEFYQYDQLGSFYSDQPKDSSLWTTERFVEEVEQVRKAIGADASNFYLLGNSWGGILAMEYALKYQQNLKGLIVSNMMASAPEYGKYAAEVLAKQMDAKVLAEVRTIEKNQDFSNPRYMELLMPHFYKQHICRLAQWPAPLDSAFKHANGEIYTMMQGPSEFGISGRLARWDVKSRLHEIAVPTLMIGAKFDTMDPKAMAWQAKAVKNGQFFFVRTAVTYPCGTIKPFSWVELSSSFAAPRGRLTDEKCVDLHF